MLRRQGAYHVHNIAHKTSKLGGASLSIFSKEILVR
jgi:hypothetical protein